MNVDDYFADYDMFTEREICDITPKGILLKNHILIEFEVCIKNYKEVNGLEKDTLCVGERNITDLSFMFYTSPKPVIIIFIKRNKISELFSKNNTYQRFHDLQKKIIQCGYRTFDMS